MKPQDYTRLTQERNYKTAESSERKEIRKSLCPLWLRKL